jgi:hypothetical protein
MSIPMTLTPCGVVRRLLVSSRHDSVVPNHRFEPTAMSPQFPIYRQRLAVSHP